MDVAKPVLDSLYKSVSEGILVFDKKGSILYTNYTADVIFGFLDEATEKRRIMECIGNDPVNDACKDAIIDVLYSETGKVTRKVTYQNGNRRYVLLMNSQYVNEEEFQGFIVVFTDVSKLETLEETERALQQYTVKNRELTSQNEILSGAFRRHLDDDVVEELLNAPSGVLLCICGHKHENRFESEQGIPAYFVNSMSGYSVPPMYARKRFSDETEARYPSVQYMCVYEDPLYVIVTIDDEKISIEGRSSAFVSPTPQEMNMTLGGGKIKFSAEAGSVEIPRR